MYWYALTCREKPPLLSRLSRTPPEAPQEIRHDLVERVRDEIAAGTYDTAEKWEFALDRLLARLEQP